MTFTFSVKDEIIHNEIDSLEALCELSAYIRFNGVVTRKKIIITIESANVARRVYKNIRNLFGINVKITVRNQRKLRVRQIYILEVYEKAEEILEKLNIRVNRSISLPEEFFLDNDEDKISYLRGIFLACGSISDPKTSGYHLEFTVKYDREAKFLIKLLKCFKIGGKVLKRINNYMVYVKTSDMISDFLKMIGAINSLFYFEDIRIYRDHKNMVNRLNNCEIANQEKTISTGLKQLEEIEYLKKHDLIDLLDEKIKEVIKYRQMYPESSFQELAYIISIENSKVISKSAINHYFIKVRKLVEQHKQKNNS